MTPRIIMGEDRSTAGSDPGEEEFQIHKPLIKEGFTKSCNYVKNRASMWSAGASADPRLTFRIIFRP